MTMKKKNKLYLYVNVVVEFEVDDINKSEMNSNFAHKNQKV